MTTKQTALELSTDNNLTLAGQIEALLFMAKEPLKIEKIANLLQQPSTIVKKVITNLQEEYKSKGINIIAVANGYIMVTAPQYQSVVDLFYLQPQKLNLANSSLEVLAIVAYKQPLTRKEIENIRGINSDQVVSSLLAKDLLRETKPSDALGHPMLLATTTHFLQVFGLNSLKELPVLELAETKIGFKN